MDNDTIIQQLAILNTRLDSQEKDVKILYKKCEELMHNSNASDVNTQKIFMLIENLSNDMVEVKASLKSLSEKPANMWETVVKNIILGVIALGMGYIGVKLGISK